LYLICPPNLLQRQGRVIDGDIFDVLCMSNQNEQSTIIAEGLLLCARLKGEHRTSGLMGTVPVPEGL
jgi:hypothetical protein